MAAGDVFFFPAKHGDFVGFDGDLWGLNQQKCGFYGDFDGDLWAIVNYG